MNLKRIIIWSMCLSFVFAVDLADLSTLTAELNNLSALFIKSSRKPSVKNVVSNCGEAKELGIAALNESILTNKNRFMFFPHNLPSRTYMALMSNDFIGLRPEIKFAQVIEQNNLAGKKILVEKYKIHLMPKSRNDLVEILKRFFNNVEKDNRLAEAIHDFKFKCTVDFTDIEALKKSLYSKGEILPIIVIYPAGKKEVAEYLLNKFIEIYGDMTGANLTPRYNKKITSLIYYAQGEGDSKGDRYKQYYTEDRVFYRKDFEGEGENKNYELKIEPQNLKYLKN